MLFLFTLIVAIFGNKHHHKNTQCIQQTITVYSSQSSTIDVLQTNVASTISSNNISCGFQNKGVVLDITPDIQVS